MKKINCQWLTAVVCVIVMSFSAGYAAEPDMSDYTAYPIFMAQAVTPNIFIMLDNSGSMNYNAYGSYPGNYGTVSDAPYGCGNVDVRVLQGRDDVEEIISTGENYTDSGDLDFSSLDVGGGTPIMIGVRFQNVTIPQGATITSAYIEFAAYDADNEAASWSISGEASDHADQYTTGAYQNFVADDNYDLSSRPETVSSVPWNNVDAWTAGNNYASPDLSAIVQEIVDRDGWSSGNAMAFKITGTGKRDGKSRNNSSSAAPRLVVTYDESDCPKYYGYFDPTSRYTYASNIFTRSDTGEFSGNWLNWLCMRRIDILRKVLMGGLATSRTGGGNTTLIGETPNQSNRVFYKWFDGTDRDETPHNGNFKYKMEGGYIKVYDSSDNHVIDYTIRVDKTDTEEPEDFFEGNISGVMQRVGDKARWGNMWFKSGSGNGYNGGKVANRVGTNMTTLITDIQNTGADSWTPLAESYFVAMRYFMQNKITDSAYDNNAIGSVNNTMDPYYQDDEFVPCAKSFVILLTDGASTMDGNVPRDLDGDGDNDLDSNRDYDGDGDSACSEGSGGCDYPDSGTDYLDDLALWARTNDLRPPGTKDLDGEQNLILYTIYAFGSDDNARSLLKDAARNGGFEDRNGNNRPDGDYGSPSEERLEWDKNGDGDPDTYYEAQDGYKLEKELLKAITDILQRASSGTSASVLATTREGDGNMLQAYFRPSVTVGTEELTWLGYLQSLWVDAKGNLREDTNANQALDVQSDRIVRYFSDPGTGDTKVKMYDVSEDAPYPAEDEDYEEVELEDIVPIWEAGRVLHQMAPNDRKIFTYLDMDNDQIADEGVADPFDSNGEVVRFHEDLAHLIKPYLGVRDGATWTYLGADHDERVENLIKFIRGTDFNGMRSRTLEVNGTTGVWKLGDIVHSTPVSINKPMERFDNIYKNRSYWEYYTNYEDRETFVIVGGNDGMLHAFTGWRKGTNCPEGSAYCYENPDPATNPHEKIGEEIWAYIPKTLLPHLKWLADPYYTHVYYVDAQPFVFDARILADGATSTIPDGMPDWGTILMVGLNMGGKHIWSEGDFDYNGSVDPNETRDFYPTYICMDVTDPRNPKLLWERSYDEMGMSSGLPGIVKIGRKELGETEKWFAVIGSGYTNYEGESTQTGHVFVVDLATGEPYQSGGNDWMFSTSSKAFFNRPITLDNNLTFEVDGVYLAETFEQGANWRSKLYRISTWDDHTTGQAPAGKHPSADPGFWEIKEVFDSPSSITAPVSLSTDGERVWIYFGTGRFIGMQDKMSSDQQYLFGLKDPLFNVDQGYANAVITAINCLDTTGYVVDRSKRVYTGSECLEWHELLSKIRKDDDTDTEWTDGWMRRLDLTSPSERCVSKFSLLSGSAFVPTYIPNADICGFGGEGYFYGLHYETGTAYYKSLLSGATYSGSTDCGEGEKVMEKISIGHGAPPPTTGIHVGSEDGATAFLQKSTGEIVEVSVETVFSLRNKLINWLDN